MFLFMQAYMPNYVWLYMYVCTDKKIKNILIQKLKNIFNLAHYTAANYNQT